MRASIILIKGVLMKNTILSVILAIVGFVGGFTFAGMQNCPCGTKCDCKACDCGTR